MTLLKQKYYNTYASDPIYVLSRPVRLEDIHDCQVTLTETQVQASLNLKVVPAPFTIKTGGIIEPVLYSNIQKLKQSLLKGIGLHGRKCASV